MRQTQFEFDQPMPTMYRAKSHAQETLDNWEQAARNGKSETYWHKLGKQIGDIVADKNAKYGSAYRSSADFLKVLFPNGIPVDRYQEVLLMVRMFDKMQRLATGCGGDTEDPWMDLAGYSMLGVESSQHRKGGSIDAT